VHLLSIKDNIYTYRELHMNCLYRSTESNPRILPSRSHREVVALLDELIPSRDDRIRDYRIGAGDQQLGYDQLSN
jgi:hypothetical protein